MAIRPLVNQRPLQPGESLPSLFVRLRRANYYQSQTAIVDLCRSHMHRRDNIYLPQHLHTWRILTAVTGLPPEALYTATGHQYAAALALPSETVSTISFDDNQPLPLLTLHARRTYRLPLYDAQFCPRCLQDGGYHRVSWFHPLAAICPRHRCFLQRGCPDCRHRLSIETIVAGRCEQCQADLAASPSMDMRHDGWTLWVQERLQAWWGEAAAPDMPEATTLPDHPVPVLLETLRGLAKTAASQPGSQNLRRRHPPPEQIVRIYAIAMKALVNWPQGFYQFLAAYGRRSGKAAGQITVAFTPLYLTWLEKRWLGPEFTFIQEAFDAYLAAHYPLSRSITRLHRYRHRAELRDRFSYLTQAEAAERLGVGPDVIQRLVEMGVLVDYEQGEDIQRHWHERLRFVRRQEFDALRKQWSDGLPLTEAARLLDVEPEVIIQLVHANLLASQGNIAEGDTVRKVRLESLSVLFAKLNSYPGGSWLLMETIALPQLVENGWDVVTVLQYVMNGDLASQWFGGGLYQVRVSRIGWERLTKA